MTQDVKLPYQVSRGPKKDSDAPAFDGDESVTKDDADLARFWISQIKSSGVESQPWMFESRIAWREYQAEGDDGRYRKRFSWQTNCYQRYWSDTMVMLPALFGPDPEPVAIKRFDNDPIANTASILLERLAEFLIADSDFNRCMRKSCLEYLHTSRSTARVYFEADFIKRKVRIPLTQQETIDENDQPIQVLVDPAGVEPTEGTPILTDEEGLPYIEKEDGEEEDVENPRILVKAMHFDEVRIAVGVRDTDQLWWRAYLVRTTTKEAKKTFPGIPDETWDAIAGQYQSSSQSDIDDNLAKNQKDLFSYWEIWDKKERRIICVNELLVDRPLKVEDDPYELVGFYPSPRDMLINERYSDLYPVPDFTQTRDIYENLHLLARRINNIAKAIKGSPLYDGSVPELDSLFNELGDGTGVAMSGYKNLTDGTGNLDSLIWYPPYDRLAQVLQQLVQTFQEQKADLDELRGIPDLKRSTSDPATTATAERIKQGNSDDRFSMRKHEVTRFARDLVESMCDLALKTFPDLKIKEIVGFAYLDPEDQQNFDAALIMLRDPRSRMVRIDLETDATNALKQQDAQDAAVQMLDVVSKYVIPMTQAAVQSPAIAPVLFKILKISVSKFQNGKHADDELKQAFDKLEEQINTPPAQPAPPPPDYEGEKLKLQQMKDQSDYALEQQKLGIEAQQQQFNNWLEQQKFTLAQRTEFFAEQLQSSQQNIDYQTFQAKLREQLMEEQRLAVQNIQIPEQKMHEKAVAQAQGPKSPVTINIQQAPTPDPTLIPVPAPQPTFAPQQVATPGIPGLF